MANALVGGLLSSGMNPGNIFVSEPDSVRLDSIRETYEINVCRSNLELIEATSVCVLAVKPQVMRSALEPLQDIISRINPLLISIAAGIGISSLQNWSNSNGGIVRVMPNTPCLVGKGAAGLYANHSVTVSQRSYSQAIMDAVGISVWLENESQMDTVTALSGSGPAYFFLMMESLQKSAMQMGLTEETAKTLCLQTALGAAALAQSSTKTLETLRLNVTSPGGTTEQGIKALDNNQFSEALYAAVDAARSRAEKLQQELS